MKSEGHLTYVFWSPHRLQTTCIASNLDCCVSSVETCKRYSYVSAMAAASRACVRCCGLSRFLVCRQGHQHQRQFRTDLLRKEI